MHFTVRANTAAVYPGLHEASTCDYVLWRDAHPLQTISPPSLPLTTDQVLLQFIGTHLYSWVETGTG